jgi:hypothetical protein
MSRGLGGHEMLGLYAEGISKMPENPGIPLLFRDIFKNAYLPYRDPETLRAFLKIIDEFSYDHSERLGDAFEHRMEEKVCSRYVKDWSQGSPRMPIDTAKILTISF